MSNPSKLYENENANEAVSTDVQSTINYQIYTVSMKSVPLLLKLYMNNPKHSKTILVTNHYLAKYGKNNKFSEQATHYLIKDLLKKINTETENSKYRSYRYSWININAKLIEVNIIIKNVFLFTYIFLIIFIYYVIKCHFDNLNENAKKKIINNIMYPLRKVLNKMAAHGAFRKLTKTDKIKPNNIFLQKENSMFMKMKRYNSTKHVEKLSTNKNNYTTQQDYKTFFYLTFESIKLNSTKEQFFKEIDVEKLYKYTLVHSIPFYKVYIYFFY